MNEEIIRNTITHMVMTMMWLDIVQVIAWISLGLSTFGFGILLFTKND